LTETTELIVVLELRVTTSEDFSVNVLITVETITSRQSLRGFFLLRPPKESPALSGMLDSSVADVSSSLDELLSFMAAIDFFNSAS
jgi:hypothetical protein